MENSSNRPILLRTYKHLPSYLQYLNVNPETGRSERNDALMPHLQYNKVRNAFFCWCWGFFEPTLARRARRFLRLARFSVAGETMMVFYAQKYGEMKFQCVAFRVLNLNLELWLLFSLEFTWAFCQLSWAPCWETPQRHQRLSEPDANRP